MALASTPTVNDLSVRRYPTPNARSPNGSNPREGRAVDSLGPTRTLVGGDSCAPTLVFCLECRVLVSPSTALSCLAVVPVVCYSTRATRALRAVFKLAILSRNPHPRVKNMEAAADVLDAAQGRGVHRATASRGAIQPEAEPQHNRNKGTRHATTPVK